MAVLCARHCPYRHKISPPLTFFVFLLLTSSYAQYIQDYQIQFINGIATPSWRRDPDLPSTPVLILNPLVILEYNCYYMPAICQNANNWINNGNRYVRLTIISNNPYASVGGTYFIFGYEFNKLAK
jgi:hypothetical protein